MITIANPIYDAVFKFRMEDQKVAKLLLSALLKKDHYMKVDEEREIERINETT